MWKGNRPEIEGRKAVIVGGRPDLAMRTLTKNGPHDLDISRQVQDLHGRRLHHQPAGHRADLFATGLTEGITAEFAAQLTTDALSRSGRPEEYAKLAVATGENARLNRRCIRLDAGQRFAPR
jgi:hypothetical protein